MLGFDHLILLSHDWFEEIIYGQRSIYSGKPSFKYNALDITYLIDWLTKSGIIEDALPIDCSRESTPLQPWNHVPKPSTDLQIHGQSNEVA